MWSDSEEYPVPTSKLYMERKREYERIVAQRYVAEGCCPVKVQKSIEDGRLIAQPAFFDWEDFGPSGSSWLEDGTTKEHLMPDPFPVKVMNAVTDALRRFIGIFRRGQKESVIDLALEKPFQDVCRYLQTDLLTASPVPDNQLIESSPQVLAGIFTRWQDLANALSATKIMKLLEVYARLDLNEEEVAAMTEVAMLKIQSDNYPSLKDLSKEDWASLRPFLWEYLNQQITEYKKIIWPGMLTPDTLIDRCAN